MPAAGELACGASGSGRLPEPELIVEALARLVSPQDLDGRRLLVTAGPTHEDLDPVRFLTNRSSGKMGYAVARVARRRGAAVTLVSGPTALADPYGVEVVRIRSAEEMLSEVKGRFPGVDALHHGGGGGRLPGGKAVGAQIEAGSPGATGQPGAKPRHFKDR